MAFAQATWSRGEVTERLHARADLEFFRLALKSCTNFYVMRHGGLRKRPGTLFKGYTKNNLRTTLIPFTFSVAQSYMLAFEANLFRVYTSAGPVLSGGLPVEVATPWTAAQIAEAHYDQSGDTLYVAHKDVSPRTITRSSDTAWTVAEMSFRDGPYLKENTQGTRLTISGQGNIIPAMTSNSTPSGLVSASDEDDPAYGAADENPDTRWLVVASSAEYWQYEPSSAKVCVGYTIQSTKIAERAPVSWVFLGWDGSSWVPLDSREGETGWLPLQARHFSFENVTAYSRFRFEFSGTEASNSNLEIAQIRLKESPDTMSALTITASSTAGINGGAGFQVSDINRPIRLFGADGKWRWFRITARTSSTVVQGKLYGPALSPRLTISRWKLGAWSATTGWPARVSFFNERLGFGRTDSQPQKVWTSATNGFDDHSVSDPLADDDAINVELLSGAVNSGQINEISWLSEGEDLMVGTIGALRSLGVQNVTEGFSATNARQKPHCQFGFAPIQPVRIGEIWLAVDFYRRALREIGFSQTSNLDRFDAPEISQLSEHLFRSGIKGLAFAPSPDSVVWVARGDGKLAAVTHEKSQEVLGFATSEIAGGIVESVAAKPGTGSQTEVWMVVRRNINGSTVRYVETFAQLEENHAVADAMYLDCAITYSGAPATSFTGANHLANEVCQVFVDGYRHPDVTVNGSGEFTLNNAGSKVVIGKLFTARAETLRFIYSGRDGSLLGRKVNITRAWADVLNTPMLRIGSLLEMGEVALRDTPALGMAAIEAVTGARTMEISSSWFGEGQLIIESNQPFAAIIRAVNLEYQTEP